jgi:hypothetical protein
MRACLLRLLCALCLLNGTPPLLPSSSLAPSASSSVRPSSVIFAAAASWASPTGTLVDGPLLSVAALNVTGALHVGSTNVANAIAEMQAQISTLLTLVTELSGRVTAAEQMSGTATPLTTTVKALRDLTAGSPLTDALIGMRDMSVTTTPLVSTLISVRDFTSGTPLYTTISGYNTRLIALENLSGSPSSTLYTTLTGHTSTLSIYGTRLSAAENLNGTATTLTNTVKQVRDLTTGTPLFTAVDGLHTLAAGTSLTDAVIGMRDMSVAGSTLVTSINNMKNLVSGSSTLVTRVLGMRHVWYHTLMGHTIGPIANWATRSSRRVAAQ